MKTTDTIETKTASKAIANKITEPKTRFPVFESTKTKLTIGQPGDKYEVEADRTADRILSMPDSLTIQPKCTECEKEETLQTKPFSNTSSRWLQTQIEEEEELIQAKSNDQFSVNEVSGWVQTKINSSKGYGSQLPKNTRSFMERRFGSDFRKVRIHNDGNAVQMNQQLGAQAFTYGNNIFFNKGKYNPESNSGRHLLAHELTHVVQQLPRLSKSDNWEGTARFQEQLEFTPDSKDIENQKKYKTPTSLDEKVEKILGENNLVNAFSRAQMMVAYIEFHAKENIIFEAGVRYLYTLSGRFSENEIRWIRIIMHSPKFVEYDHDFSLPVKTSSPLIEEEESDESEEELTREEAVSRLENASGDLEKLEAWLQVAEFSFSGKAAEKIAGLKEKLGQFSGPLSTAIDIKNKTEAGAKLIASLHHGLSITPGGPGGVKAASNILYALGEFGQEIPILGGAIGGYLEFLKLPNQIVKFGKKYKIHRLENRPENREVPNGIGVT